MGAPNVIEELVNEMAETTNTKTIRDELHRLVDESCDQLELDSVDFKHDKAEAQG